MSFDLMQAARWIQNIIRENCFQITVKIKLKLMLIFLWIWTCNSCCSLHVICLNCDVLLITEKPVYIIWYPTVPWHQKYKTKEKILLICGMFKVFQENAKWSSQNSQHSH